MTIQTYALNYGTQAVVAVGVIFAEAARDDARGEILVTIEKAFAVSQVAAFLLAVAGVIGATTSSNADVITITATAGILGRTIAVLNARARGGPEGYGSLLMSSFLKSTATTTMMMGCGILSTGGSWSLAATMSSFAAAVNYATLKFF